MHNRRLQSSTARCVLIVLMLIAVQTNIGDCNAAEINYRLNTTIMPESYDIKIRPYIIGDDSIKTSTFDGEVNITLHAVLANVQVITLHKRFLKIERSELYETQTEKLVQNFTLKGLSFEIETDKLSIFLNKSLVVNTTYTLYFKYKGRIRNGTSGLFRVDYSDAKGHPKWMILTQSQRIDARTIFPCLDEPAFKAKFRLSISRPKEYMSVFNTRLTESKVDEYDANRYLDQFEWTPPMSSYLFAFAVAEYVKRGDADLVILSRPEYYNHTEFVYGVAKSAIEAYNNYTQLPYKNLGNDIIQMASSPIFPYNGMENWGLILYRDPVLIVDSNYSNGWKDKQYSMSVIVHEMAHMWFGNSVTFAWWSYFWLNEAFARYYQYYLAHEIYPEYQLDQQFIVNQVHKILGRDAVNTTLPLSTAEELVRTPSEIASMFSGIAYAKGASILRMFRNLMGRNYFDKGIQEYLKEFHLKNVRPSDFFKHLKHHWPANQHVNLDRFFSEWTEQVGYPMLIVKVSKDRKEVTLEQKRFLTSPGDSNDSELTYTIPITYTTDQEKNFTDLSPRVYFNSSEENLKIRFEKPFNWILFNIQQSNFHRVLYDNQTLDRIIAALKEPFHSGIHVINRAQLIDDIFNFAQIGMVDYVDIFRFLEYLKTEKEYLPWQATFNGLPRISQRLDLPQQKSFGKFLNEITSGVFKELGFRRTNETILDVYNRNNIVYWTCKYGNLECNREAKSMLMEANRTQQLITSDFRETVYCSAIRDGGFEYYDIVNQWYLKENRSSEKELLLRSLGCTLKFVSHHFERILTDEIPQEHKRMALKSLYAENPENVEIVLNLIMKQYDQLAIQLGGFAALGDVVLDICNYISTERDNEALEEFVEDHSEEFGELFTTLDAATGALEDELEWAEERLERLSLYLETRNSAPLKSLSLLLILFCSAFSKFLI